MKNFNRALCAIFAFVLAISLGACTDPNMDESGKTSVQLKGTTPTPYGAEVVFSMNNIKEIAYMVRDTEILPAAILKGGRLSKVSGKQATISVTGLESESLYTVFFAFRDINGNVLEDVVKIEFMTTAYGDSVLTVTDRMYDGFAVHIQIPEEVKARGNALRYATASMPMYNYSKMMGTIELDMLLYNAGQYTTKDKTVIYDEYHNVERDENGNEVIGDDGASASYSDPKVPGEPGYFLVGEYGYMDDPEERIVYADRDNDGVKEVFTVSSETDYLTESIWWYPAGWPSGYYKPMYDWNTFAAELKKPDFDTEKHWSGYYQRIFVETLDPEVIEDGVTIEVTNKTCKDATITFYKSSDISQFCYLITTESEYQTQILPILENNEDYVRWFVGSYFAMMSFGVQSEQDDITEINLSGWFTDTNGMAGQEIRVMATGIGDSEGKIQSFDTLTFKLPEITKPDPVVIVTPKYDANDPYHVTFNIKNADPSNEIDEAIFACNYVREFDAAIGKDGYEAFLKSLNNKNGYNKFSKNELAQINCKSYTIGEGPNAIETKYDGFDFKVSSRDAATTRLAVLVYNKEGSSNHPDEAESPAVAEYTTPNANYPERVDSELFEKLQGEWVATAPTQNYVAITDEDGNTTSYGFEDAGTCTSDITILGSLSCPEVMPDKVWSIYEEAGVTREKAEALYAELVSLTEWYNNRTRGFNRLLCLGYDFADPKYMLSHIATPYDLFTMENYSVSQVGYMFYDFGPKWNLEIDADGSVWLPLNIELEYPLVAWSFGTNYTFYMLGVSESSYIAGDIVDAAGNTTLKARFPVEVSDDYNTITIKPIEYEKADKTIERFYPCVAQLTQGQATPVNPRVKGDVVLKRKSATASAAKANVAPAANAVRQAVPSLGEAPVPMSAPQYTMTPMDPSIIKPIKRVVREEKIEPGVEAYHKRATAAVKAYYGIK